MKVSHILCSTFAVVVLALSVSSIPAQETVSPERAALIKEIAELTGGKKQFNEIVSGSMTAQRDTFKETFAALVKGSRHPTPLSDPTLMKLMEESMDRISARSQEFFTTRFNFDKFVDDVFVPVYAKHFTDDELRDLIAFYKTPSGQKMTRETPQLMVDMTVAMSKHFLPEFTEFMSHVLDDEMTAIKKTLSAQPKARRSS